MEKNTNTKISKLRLFLNKLIILVNSFGMVIAILSEALNQAWIALPEVLRNEIPNAKYIAIFLFALNTLAKIFVINIKKEDKNGR